MCLLSIIVPVYNAQAYLRRCVQSVLDNCLSDFELILVNDGSTDFSGQLCDQLAEEYDFIRSYHQPNLKQGEARNNGLRHSYGDYVFFLDSDDMLRPGAIAQMLSNCQEYSLDISASSAIKVDSSLTEIEKVCSMKIQPDTIFSGEQYLTSYPYHHDAAIWLYIYRRQFLMDHDIFFLSNVYHEDCLFNLATFIHAQRILYHDYEHYYYIDTPGSTMNKKNKKRCLDAICISNQILEYVKNSQVSKQAAIKCRQYGAFVAHSSLLSCIKQDISLKELMVDHNRHDLVHNLRYRPKYWPALILLALHLEELYAMAFHLVKNNK